MTKSHPVPFAVLFGLFCLVGSVYAQTLQVGVLAFRPAPETLQRWQPTIDHLNEQLPHTRFVLQALSYDQLNEKVAANELDFVLSNPSHYVFLMHRHNINRLATMTATHRGVSVSGFGGVIVVRSDRNDLRHVHDLEGKRIAAPSEESLGGYQLQASLLMGHGFDPKKDIQMVFTGMPHDRAIASVLEGRSDAAFVRTGLLEALAKEGQIVSGQLRVIGPRALPHFPFALSTDLVPEWPFAYLPHLPDGVVKEVAMALYGVDANSLAAQAGGYVTWSIPGDYEPVRQVLQRLRLPPYDERIPLTWRDITSQYGEFLIAIGLLVVSALLLLIHALLANRKLTIKSQTIEAIAGSMGEGLYVINGHGVTTYANPSALTMLGLQRHELIGHVAHDIFHRHGGNDHMPIERCPIFATIQSGRSYYGVETFARKGGEHFEARVRSSPLTHGDTVLGSVAVFEDVTEEMRSKRQIEYLNQELRNEIEEEVALRLKGERIYQAIYDNTPEGILIVDEHGLFLRANPMAEKMLHMEPGALVGRSFVEISPEIQPETGLFSDVVGREILGRAMAGHTEQFEWYCLDANRSLVVLQVLLAPFEQMDKELLVMWRDMSETKKLQNEREYQQAVLIQQAKLAELGSMIGAIAHQWKQPLNGVSLVAQGLLDSYDYQELDRAELEHSVEKIVELTEFMAQTIDDFRNFYKPSKVREPFGLGVACRGVISLLSTQLSKEGIDVTLCGPQDVQAVGAIGEFKQVILNLINNARDAFEQNRTQNPEIHISFDRDEHTTIIAIDDNAGGISEHLLPTKIFSPFTSTKGDKGTGIGLSLVKTIIEEKMSGRIQVSNTQEGARFVIWLPSKIELKES